MTDDARSDSERGWTKSSQLGQLEARVIFNEGKMAGLAPHSGAFDWISKFVLPGLFAVCTALVGVIWWNLNGQISTLQTDVRVLQTQNSDSSKQVAALTQRIQDLVDTINRSDGMTIDRRKK